MGGFRSIICVGRFDRKLLLGGVSAGIIDRPARWPRSGPHRQRPPRKAHFVLSDAIRRHSTDPDTDIRRFRDAILFAWATVNRDAHARNYSMLIAPGSVRLSPLYDLGSALPFTRKKIGEVELAMRVGDDHTVYRSDAADALLGLAARLRLPAAGTLDAAEQVTATAPAAIRAAIESLPESTPLETAEQLAHRVQRRSENCLKAVTANRNRIVRNRRSGAPNGNDG